MPRSAGHGSLFERLEPDAQPRRAFSRQDQARQRIQAIKRHLEWLLNTRKGCSPSSPDLGLSDLNDASMGSTDLQLKVSEDIRRSIAAFEPRVKVKTIHTRTDPSQPLELYFRIDCIVPINMQEEQVEIDLVINGLDRTTHVI